MDLIDTAENYDATALFTIPVVKPGVDERRGLLVNGRPDLYRDLRQGFGVDAHVSRGRGSVNESAGTVEAVIRPVYEGDAVRLQKLGTQMLAAYNAFRPTGTPYDTDRFVTALNPMDLRRYLRHKDVAGREILAPLGLYRENHLIGKDAARDTQLSDINFARQLVLKPNGGFASRDISSGSPEELLNDVRSHDTEDFLVEERLDFSTPFPELRGRTPMDEARLNEANRNGVNKELRLYSFGDRNWRPVARIAELDELRLGGDEWVYVDEDSVPQAALDAGNAVKDALDAKFSHAETLLAVDVIYVTSESRPDPHWEVMEVNAEPYVMRAINNGEVGRDHGWRLAAQLARIATARKDVK